MPQVQFLKVHGNSRDSVLLDSPLGDIDVATLPSFVRRLCSYDGPVGAGGVYFVDRNLSPPNVSYMRSNGAHGEDGGDRYRCVGRFLLEVEGRNTVVIHSGATMYDTTSVPSTVPDLTDVAIRSQTPVVTRSDAFMLPMQSGPTLNFWEVSLPERHLVSIVDRFGMAPDAQTLLAMQRDGRLPRDASVSLVFGATGLIREFVLTTIESAEGVTLSSAAGSTAAAAALVKSGRSLIGETLVSRAIGGPTNVSCEETEEGLYCTVTGNATVVYEGVIDSASMADGDMAFPVTAHLNEIMAFESRYRANEERIGEIIAALDS